MVMQITPVVVVGLLEGALRELDSLKRLSYAFRKKPSMVASELDYE